MSIGLFVAFISSFFVQEDLKRIKYEKQKQIQEENKENENESK